MNKGVLCKLLLVFLSAIPALISSDSASHRMTVTYIFGRVVRSQFQYFSGHVGCLKNKKTNHYHEINKLQNKIKNLKSSSVQRVPFMNTDRGP